MKRQGRRATVLTLLAAIYLPLTSVTGIFGMNIQEILEPNSAPVAHHCWMTFGVVFGVTVLFFLGYSLLGYVHEKMRATSRAQDNKAYKIA